MNTALKIWRIATISLLGTLLFLSIVPPHLAIIWRAVLFNQIWQTFYEIFYFDTRNFTYSFNKCFFGLFKFK